MKPTAKYLSGPEPQHEIEKKTMAQLQDEREPSYNRSVDSQADRIDDSIPAIERDYHLSHVPLSGGTGAKPKLEASAEFTAEMHAISRAMRKKHQRDEKVKRHEAKVKAAEMAERERIESPYKEPLTPAEEAEQKTEELYAKNMEKLYPDPISEHAPLLSKEQHEQTEKIREQQAEFDSNASQRLTIFMMISGAIQILATLYFIIAAFVLPDKNLNLKAIFLALSFSSYLFSIIIAYMGGRFCSRHHIPLEQHNTYPYIYMLPFVAFRLYIVIALSYLTAMIGIPGLMLIFDIVATLFGLAIGSACHYSIVNRFNLSISNLGFAINIITFGAFHAVAVNAGLLLHVTSTITGIFYTLMACFILVLVDLFISHFSRRIWQIFASCQW